MSNFVILAVFLAIGVGLRALGPRVIAFSRALNLWVIRVALPAMVLLNLHSRSLPSGAWKAASAPWLVFFGAVIFLKLAGFGRDRKRFGALLLTAGLSNTSFLGYPMIEALFGTLAMPTAVLVDQGGSFPALALAGIPAAAILSGRERDARAIAKRIFFFPPFLAFLAALALHGVAFPEAISQILHWIGVTLGPASILAVGLQLDLRFDSIREYKKELAFGLMWKLAFAPLLVLIALHAVGMIDPATVRVIVCECAMAPMITGAIVAAESGLEPRLASLITGLGILASFITIPIWARLLA